MVYYLQETEFFTKNKSKAKESKIQTIKTLITYGTKHGIECVIFHSQES